MTPDEEMQREIERYRAMTGEQRLEIALELTTRAWEVEREEIRREFPNADGAEIERRFRVRRMTANERETEQERLTASAAITRDAFSRSRSTGR